MAVPQVKPNLPTISSATDNAGKAEGDGQYSCTQVLKTQQSIKKDAGGCLGCYNYNSAITDVQEACKAIYRYLFQLYLLYLFSAFSCCHLSLTTYFQAPAE